MAERNSLFVSDTGGVDTVEDTRLGFGALMMPGSSSTAMKSGFRPGPSAPGLVTASGTPDGNVHVAPLQAFIQSARATAGGMYVISSDSSKTVNVLSTPANATNPRHDLIIAQQNDKFYGDATNNMNLLQVVGTPSGSPADPSVTGSVDYLPLARVNVRAATTTILGTDITDLRPSGLYTVALGGLLPVSSVTVRAALAGAYEGMAIYRTDFDWIEVYDGTKWRVRGTATVANVAGLTGITDPHDGLMAVTLDTRSLYVYNSTASAWVQTAGGMPTTSTSFTGFTVASGWSSTSQQMRYTVMGPLVTLWFTLTYTGTSITSDSTGNIADTLTITLPTALIPECDVTGSYTDGFGSGAWTLRGIINGAPGALSVRTFSNTGQVKNGNTYGFNAAYSLL